MPSEFAALLEELRLIKRFRPRFNVAMKRDGRNYCFIKITKGPAPKLVVVRGPGSDDASVYYGPFMGAIGVGEAVRELNDVLGLRDCAADQRMHFADQPELFDIVSAHAGLHSVRGEEVPRSVRRRMHGAAVRRSAVRSRARFSTASTTVRSSIFAARWKRRANGWSTSAPASLRDKLQAARGAARAVRASALRRRDAVVRLHRARIRRRRPRLSDSPRTRARRDRRCRRRPTKRRRCCG